MPKFDKKNGIWGNQGQNEEFFILQNLFLQKLKNLWGRNKKNTIKRAKTQILSNRKKNTKKVVSPPPPCSVAAVLDCAKGGHIILEGLSSETVSRPGHIGGRSQKGSCGSNFLTSVAGRAEGRPEGPAELADPSGGERTQKGGYVQPNPRWQCKQILSSPDVCASQKGRAVMCKQMGEDKGGMERPTCPPHARKF